MERDLILRSFVNTVLSDITHMSELHVKSTIVDLAKQAEKIFGMDIKNRAQNEEIDRFWELDGNTPKD